MLEITFLVLFQVFFFIRWKWTLVAFEVISVYILSFSTCSFRRRRWSDVAPFWVLVSWTFWKSHNWQMSFWTFMLNQSQLAFEWIFANVTFEWSVVGVSGLFVDSNTGHVRSNRLILWDKAILKLSSKRFSKKYSNFGLTCELVNYEDIDWRSCIRCI